ncbi:ribonucleoside-diphosphate reductase subunit alpha [Ammoniphilus sp. CFH 90114]|uniref:ribonucleoside-diphosphate reductase subunit alpha n=1 Tax=Ammoniphilus sp. CFH 90114 TaxID=2493665 RepID=UPI00100E32D4|nr:ribonucleoside-diphosphate reductase subunit alpha [Ammoniphilus sp. CFH 90114]RXT15483.1 ribonucleoside-diphosphate reductase subunit alpha [Ammoniphilus sp. CFH 90114]
MEIIKRNGDREELIFSKLKKVIDFACEGQVGCDSLELEVELLPQFKNLMTTKEIQRTLIQVAAEKTSVESPNWQYVASKLLAYDLYKEAALHRGYKHFGYGDFYLLVKELMEKGRYGSYILENYSADEVEELGAYIKPERDYLFNYIGLKTLADRYLIKGFNGEVMELPQEMFMGVAMHLAMKEQNKVMWAKQFYDVLSNLELTVATPTLANARKPHHQLSSCFIDTVPDNLWGIYQVDQSFAQVSKYGGGMGIYVGKVRSKGSNIRGYKGVAGGVVPWIKNYNNTALAVDQLGVRAGAVSIYLDVWHKDILDFLNLKTNNGDDRMKAHDVFPGVCIPDLFMKTVQDRGTWYLFDPHEILQKKGYSIEDSWGEEWEERYLDCVQDPEISKDAVPAMEIMKKMLASSFETGTPFFFFRDTVNRANPNKHKGIIYCSNLCTEICQNMSATEKVNEVHENGLITTQVKSGDFVVCNLSSLNLGRVNTREDIARVIPIQMRMMDNVIDLNDYPIPQAEITCQKYRAVGLGTSGYHQMLVQKKISWESEQHTEYVDQVYEWINYYTIKASMELAKEKGAYPAFEGSDWHTGEYFHSRGYDSLEWQMLQEEVARNGVRNAWMIAIAPTASTSLIAGSTAGIDPIFRRFFVEEKKNALIPQTAPQLNSESYWYYKEAHHIDQRWSIKAAGVRQRHIDQAQSFNLYITPDISARDFFELYLSAWENGLKTVYYCRNQSLEVEECESCSS